MTITRAEQEVIVLNAVWSMIDEMVNFAVFLPLQGKTQDTNLIPHTSETLRLFHVLLGDFLSPLGRKGRGPLPFNLPAPPSRSRPSDLTFLFYLRVVAEDAKLSPCSAAISQPTEAFANWLEQDSLVEDVWLPSIEVEASLQIKRIEWIKICADIGKHNFARLETNVGKIVRILTDHNKPIDAGMGYAVLPEFWDWFHRHLFAYHASTIAEFLNNIRWGIYKYLRPTFATAYRDISDPEFGFRYEFEIPDDINTPISRTMFWDLMNMVRSKPLFPHFTVTRHLKERY